VWGFFSFRVGFFGPLGLVLNLFFLLPGINQKGVKIFGSIAGFKTKFFFFFFFFPPGYLPPICFLKKPMPGGSPSFPGRGVLGKKKAGGGLFLSPKPGVRFGGEFYFPPPPRAFLLGIFFIFFFPSFFFSLGGSPPPLPPKAFLCNSSKKTCGRRGKTFSGEKIFFFSSGGGNLLEFIFRIKIKIKPPQNPSVPPAILNPSSLPNPPLSKRKKNPGNGGGGRRFYFISRVVVKGPRSQKRALKTGGERWGFPTPVFSLFFFMPPPKKRGLKVFPPNHLGGFFSRGFGGGWGGTGEPVSR